MASVKEAFSDPLPRYSITLYLIKWVPGLTERFFKAVSIPWAIFDSYNRPPKMIDWSDK